MIKIPPYAQAALDTLEKNGHSAYIVGGCVRDTLLGIAANDYDITTDALPNHVAQAFDGYHVIETGIKHGTVTVVIDKSPVEITTYRIDGEYKDNRRPENVIFTDRVEDDLSRRDFTINAMAYNPKRGIVDVFGGREDLRLNLIRCVGNADTRFKEDALRILRALRFASVLGFEIEENTKLSIFKNKMLLKNIAAERIQAEFFKLVCGRSATEIVDEYRDVIAVFIPQIVPMFDFEQHSKYHCYDVWHHSLCAMSHTQPLLVLRLSALFHDIGKPDCFTLDESGYGHFYAHAKSSINHTRDILNALKCDNVTKHDVLQLIEYHDAQLCETKKSVKKWLGKLGAEAFDNLIAIQKADTNAHASQYVDDRLAQLSRIHVLARQIIDEGECFSLKDLALDGRDMIALGFEGKEIGNILATLLELVIDGKVPNDRQSLTNEVKKYINIK